MINFDDVTVKNIKEHPNLSRILDHPYIILIIGGSGSGKTNTLLNLISHQPDTDKNSLYTKDPYKAKLQLLINKCRSLGSIHCDDPEAFIKHSNDMNDIYENIDEYNSNKHTKYRSHVMI